jgi:hypothetical protein
VYSARILDLRFMQWVMQRELARLTPEADEDGVIRGTGEALLAEIEEALIVEKVDAEVAEAMAAQEHDRLERRLDTLDDARNREKQPVHEGMADDEFYNPDDSDDLVHLDIECTRCGMEMSVAVPEGVTPLPICPICRSSDPEAVAELLKEQE